MHCRPQSSTAVSCSWTPPEADHDSYEVDCRRDDDSGERVYSMVVDRDAMQHQIEKLDPHRLYAISVRARSGGLSSPPATGGAVTMIDRKYKGCRFISCPTTFLPVPLPTPIFSPLHYV